MNRYTNSEQISYFSEGLIFLVILDTTKKKEDKYLGTTSREINMENSVWYHKGD